MRLHSGVLKNPHVIGGLNYGNRRASYKIVIAPISCLDE